MTHVAMARIAIAKIQAFMTSLQGHIDACEQEKCVAKKVTSININCKERYYDEIHVRAPESGLKCKRFIFHSSLCNKSQKEEKCDLLSHPSGFVWKVP